MYDHAFADIAETIRLDPHQAVYYENRGKLFALCGSFRRALDDYQVALIKINALDPHRPNLEEKINELVALISRDPTAFLQPRNPVISVLSVTQAPPQEDNPWIAVSYTNG